MKVRVKSVYSWNPCFLDQQVPLATGAKVRVINLPGCPKANTMNHCYVERVDTGEFVSLVCCNSLETLR